MFVLKYNDKKMEKCIKKKRKSSMFYFSVK